MLLYGDGSNAAPELELTPPPVALPPLPPPPNPDETAATPLLPTFRRWFDVDIVSVPR